MNRNMNRTRHRASKPTLRVLRLAGWRYSNTREAWVHRTFNGRIGPVFVDETYEPHPELTDLSLFEAPPVRLPVLIAGEGERPPLPRRAASSPSTSSARVLTRLSEGEDPRVVQVDGHPPKRGIEVPTPTPDGVVVPIKTARATG
jgi:hypothetical protein